MRDPTRTRRDARERYKGYLQQTLSCISLAVWSTAPTRELEEFALEPWGDIQLRRDGDDPLWLKLGQVFHFEEDERHPGEWKVKTDGYAYTVTLDEDLSQELLSWHWHPSSRPDPHLHVGRRHPEFPPFGKVHVPTGRVALERVVFFLIEELRVVPLRADWRQVLEDTLRRFEHWRTWA